MFIFYYFFYITLPKSDKKTLQLTFLCELFFYIIKIMKMNARKFIKSQINMFILDIVSISLNPKKCTCMCLAVQI